MLILQDDSAATALLRRPPMVTYDCEAAYTAIQNQMKNCAQLHPKCPKLEDKILPRRLLDVGSDLKAPKLIIPETGTVGRYCALSYCWGQSQSVLLTQDRLQKGLLTFPLQSLPATLKDAIVICRKLGFNYLWVDALCIVQDSPDAEDWERESATMDEIFGNAVLTIAASAAQDTSRGIFHFPGKGERLCSIPYHLEKGVIGKAYVQFNRLDEDGKQPLATRAWAFQEALLSSRIVSFQTNKLVWECDTIRWDTNGLITQPSILKHRSEKSWQDLIEEYSRCELTFPSDRLSAIVGLVKRRVSSGIMGNLSVMTGNDPCGPYPYVAGLWQSRLVEHLCWYNMQVLQSLRPRPTTYIAPTFSWASIQHPVTFTAVQSLYAMCPRSYELFDKLDIHEVNVATSEIQPFGSIELSPPSFLRVSACLEPAVGLEWPTFNHEHKVQALRKANPRDDIYFVPRFDVLPPVGELTLDLQPARSEVDSYSSQSSFLWFLKVSRWNSLIVRPVVKEGLEGVENVFERVGFMQHKSPRLFFNTTKTLIILV